MNSRYQFIAADSICHAFSLVFGQTEHHFIADGQIHRLDDPTGRPGNKACWYLCDPQSGVFGSWRQEATYCFNLRKPDFLVTDPNWAEKQKQLIKEQRAKGQQARQVLQQETCERAQRIWNKSAAVIGHDYLQRKHLAAYNLRQYKGALVVPLVDNESLQNLQFIKTDGSKRFLLHGKVSGCYSKLGEFDKPEALLICEGWATGATLHMQYQLPVACAMFAGNLLHVAKALRAQYPTREIIICADDDRQSQLNAGVSYASVAATAINASWAKPTWPAEAPVTLSDFNDLYVWLLKHGGMYDIA